MGKNIVGNPKNFKNLGIKNKHVRRSKSLDNMIFCFSVNSIIYLIHVRGLLIPIFDVVILNKYSNIFMF